MGAANSKCDTLCLNGQGGKTRRIQDMIKEDDAANPGNYINFLIQANNRSLVEQTGVRMTNELYEPAETGPADAKIEGACFSWYSGTSGPRITVDDLVGKILTPDGVTMVICCANRKRLDYLSEVMTKLAAALKRFKSSIKFKIWIDEADASMCYWRDAGFQDIMKSPIVEKVTMVTATVDAIVKEFGAIRVIPLENPTLPIYFRCQDYKIELQDHSGSAVDFIQSVVESNKERYLTPGARIFAPGECARKSHEAVATYALSVGAAVVILNGLRKEVRIPSEIEGEPARIIPLPKMSDAVVAEELGRAIGRLYHDNHLERFPLFVTGNICLGRGITFQNDLFLFDHQILPDAFDTRAAAYQAACRGAGNIRGLSNFIERAKSGFQPTLVTTPGLWRKIVEAETIASTLATRAHATGNCVMTKDDLEIASGNAGGLEKSHVPLRFPLPADLQDIDDRYPGSSSHIIWETTILDCLKGLSPELHDDLTKNYTAGPINNYRMAGMLPGTAMRYKSMFRPIYEASKKKERARVPKFPGAEGKNIWYAALDHSNKHMVICRWQGAA